MSNVVIINGGNSRVSRLSAVHQYVDLIFTEAGFQTQSIYVHELPARDLITANFASDAIKEANNLLEQAEVVVVLTPIYKASYTGILKTYLDLIPQKGLKNKIILPIAVGGSIGHLLALEYSLKPVLSVLGATDILNSIYVLDQQIERLENGEYAIESEATERLVQELQKIKIKATIE